MTSSTGKRLKLKRETLRRLGAAALGRVAAGARTGQGGDSVPPGPLDDGSRLIGGRYYPCQL